MTPATILDILLWASLGAMAAIAYWQYLRHMRGKRSRSLVWGTAVIQVMFTLCYAIGMNAARVPAGTEFGIAAPIVGVVVAVLGVVAVHRRHR